MLPARHSAAAFAPRRFDPYFAATLCRLFSPPPPLRCHTPLRHCRHFAFAAADTLTPRRAFAIFRCRHFAMPDIDFRHADFHYAIFAACHYFRCLPPDDYHAATDCLPLMSSRRHSSPLIGLREARRQQETWCGYAPARRCDTQRCGAADAHACACSMRSKRMRRCARAMMARKNKRVHEA